MKTAFANPPGFYAANTSPESPHLPPNTMRIYCARLEAYDLPLNDSSMDEITFEIIFAQAEGKPEIARALLKLDEAIKGNEEMLREQLRS